MNEKIKELVNNIRLLISQLEAEGIDFAPSPKWCGKVLLNSHIKITRGEGWDTRYYQVAKVKFESKKDDTNILLYLNPLERYYPGRTCTFSVRDCSKLCSKGKLSKYINYEEVTFEFFNSNEKYKLNI